MDSALSALRSRKTFDPLSCRSDVHTDAEASSNSLSERGSLSPVSEGGNCELRVVVVSLTTKEAAHGMHSLQLSTDTALLIVHMRKFTVNK